MWMDGTTVWMYLVPLNWTLTNQDGTFYVYFTRYKREREELQRLESTPEATLIRVESRLLMSNSNFRLVFLTAVLSAVLWFVTHQVAPTAKFCSCSLVTGLFPNPGPWKLEIHTQDPRRSQEQEGTSTNTFPPPEMLGTQICCVGCCQAPPSLAASSSQKRH